uniref:Uncharacterized protein n=1 Tax=Arundo donax TaxID=35708 RepID=A0A0A8XUT0_ARUDO
MLRYGARRSRSIGFQEFSGPAIWACLVNIINRLQWKCTTQ